MRTFVSTGIITGIASAWTNWGISTGDTIAAQLSAVLKGSFISSL